MSKSACKEQKRPAGSWVERHKPPVKTCSAERARCASHLHCSPPSGSEEKRCFYIHPHPCVNAKRSSARVNGPPFHAARERDSSVKYSYCNPAGLRWHLDSLTQTLQVITRANDFEEFTRFSRALRSRRRHTACLDLGTILLCAMAKAARRPQAAVGCDCACLAAGSGGVFSWRCTRHGNYGHYVKKGGKKYMYVKVYICVCCSSLYQSL